MQEWSREESAGLIAEAFAPLIGMPAWRFQQGYSSFLTLEFGEPRLETSMSGLGMKLPDGSRRVRKRHVTPRGDWHLWIYMTSWTLSFEGERLAHCESSRRLIGSATRVLDGQALASVELREPSGMVFDFEFGGRLEVKPYEGDELNELWLLYEPSGEVFSLWSDGCCSRCRGDERGDRRRSDDEA
ncbi:MAG: hypothetical protein AAF533_17810 [Acidobacteriota bacterium]